MRPMLRWITLGMLPALTACSDPGGGDTEGHETGSGQEITLPPPTLDGTMSVEAAMAARRSVRRFSDRALTASERSQLLWSAQGITEPRRGFRAAPSAGATFPLELRAIGPDGVFRYIPDGHRLVPVTTQDRREALAAAALGQDWVREAPLTIAISAVKQRTTRRYGERGTMYVHMEAGHAAQNLHLQAVALGLGSVPVGAFDPARAARVLDLPADETLLYLIPVGEPAGHAR